MNEGWAAKQAALLLMLAPNHAKRPQTAAGIPRTGISHGGCFRLGAALPAGTAARNGALNLRRRRETRQRRVRNGVQRQVVTTRARIIHHGDTESTVGK
jgi:hypothetical protein